MKKIILAILVVGSLGACAFYANKSARQDAELQDAAAAVKFAGKPTVGPTAAGAPSRALLPPPAAKKEDKLSDEFVQAVETVMSPQTSFDEKQSAWGHLQDSGQMDHAVSELEKLAAANPDSPAIINALGRAYLGQLNTIQGITQEGALRMKVDQVFVTALKLDPTNWDAQFWRAVAMTYWPPFMNKTPEVIGDFQNLIQQQEAQTSQPQFATTYLRLGEIYQKQGDNDKAQQVWQRGAQLYPEYERLQKKVNPPSSQP